MREAHPTDGAQALSNILENVLVAQAETFDERTNAAHACSLGLDISIPTLIDEMTNEIGEAYAGNPDRLYLVNEEGRIAYRSRPGPFGFEPDELEEAIVAHLDIFKRLPMTITMA